jgi:cytochrome P450
VPRAGGTVSLLQALSRDPLGTSARLRHQHGAIVSLPIPGLRPYLVSDPAAVQEALTLTNRAYAKGLPRRGDPAGPGFVPLGKVFGDGLLTSSGSLWRRQRRLIGPLFQQGQIAGYGTVFAGLAEQVGLRWRDGEVRDVHRDMTELTLAIIARTVFAVDLDSELVSHIRRSIAANLSTVRRRVLPWGRLADRLPLPSTRRFSADRAALDAVIHGMVAQRRAIGPGGGDLLSRLLSARDEETGEHMPDDLVRDEAVTMLLAGHETTANALAWALHLLGADPQVQRRLGAELDDVLGGRLPGAADVPLLPYTAAVLRESMRLYPPAWVLARRLLTPREVCGYQLPAGAVLVFSPWVVHRDPAWWPEPDSFQPQRWLSEPVERPRYAYFPFGGGPRQCIGRTFAEMEGILTLATLCRRWWLEPAGGAPVTPHAVMTLRPAGGVPMRLNSIHVHH